MAEEMTLRNHNVFYLIGNLDSGENLKSADDASFEQAVATKILKENPIIIINSLDPKKKFPDGIFVIIGNLGEKFDNIQADLEDMHCTTTTLLIQYQITTHFPELFANIANELNEYVYAKYGDYGINVRVDIQDAKIFDGKEIKEVDFDIQSFSNYPDTLISEDLLSYVGAMCLEIQFKNNHIPTNAEVEAFNRTFYGE